MTLVSMKNTISITHSSCVPSWTSLILKVLGVVCMMIWATSINAQVNDTSTEKGIPLSRLFIPKEYNAHGQNFAIAQDTRGLMYFGNFAGVLEYDGVTWRTIPTQNITKVSALYVSKFGRVFVGALGEFGYLKPDSLGTLYFESLSKDVKTNFGAIINIFQTNEGIYFISQRHIFLLTPKGLKEFKVNGTIMSSFYANEKIIVLLKDSGPQFIEGQSLIPISKAPSTPTLFDLTAVFPISNNEFLLLTSSQGLFKLTNNTIQVFDCEANKYLTSNQTSAGTVLDNGDLAISTLNQGVLVVSPQGQIKNRIKDNDYLQDLQVNAMFSDRDGMLWLALNNGIVQIEIASPIEGFNEFSNLKGEVKAISRYNGRLYVGTLNGLFSVNGFLVNNIAGINASCFGLTKSSTGLWIATNKGLLKLVGNNSVQQITPFYSLCVYTSQSNPNHVFVGQQNGLGMITTSGKGQSYKLVPQITEQIMNITEDENGNLWLETLTEGLIKFNISSNQVKKYTTQEGLSVMVNNRVVATSKGLIAYNQKGVFRYNPTKDIFETFNLFQTKNSSAAYWNGIIVEDQAKNLWTTRGDEKVITLYQKLDQPNKPYQEVATPFLPLAETSFGVIYPDINQVVWFGGAEGLIKFDLKTSRDYNREYASLIRKISKGNQILYNGYPTDTVAKQNKMAVRRIELDYQDNNILFEFAAPSFHANEILEFQYYLENFDQAPSEWTTQSQKEYTNLPPGNYQFKVRARNIYSIESEETVVQFRVLTPLYLQWWAILLYGILIGTAIYFSVRWRLRVLEREKLELENLIQERTEEVVSQKVELEKQSDELTNKNDQLEKIDIIVQAINTEINFGNLFQTVLTRLKVIRNMDCASALIYDKDTNGYRFKALYGFSELSLLGAVQLTPEQAEKRYLDEAIEVYEDIYFKNDIKYDKLNNMIDQLVTPKSMITIVIKVDNHIEGFITLENCARASAFDQRDFNMIKNLKEHLIAAYIKTRLLENLEKTLSNLKETQEELIRQERLASVGQLTKGIVDRILNPLNYINNFSESSKLLIDELQELIDKYQAELSDDLKDDAYDLLDVLKNSISKIYDHGSSSTRIVKDMQKLLKEKSREFFETDLNNFVENRAKTVYQEFKNNNKDFNGQLLMNLDKQPAKTKILPPELGDVITSLVDNALYTLTEKSKLNKGFEPLLTITTEVASEEVLLKIKDNGKGIPKRDLALLFSPFFTTKPTSKGTGLGLFMSKDIIELHKGKISINSKEGEFTEVVIVLPTVKTSSL